MKENLKEIMKELLNQYPPKSTYLQNENKLITALKNLLVSLENEILFLKKEMETENQLISTLMSTQLLTQKQSLRKYLNPDYEELNEKNKIEKKKIVVQNTANQKTYTAIPSSNTTENIIQCNNTQNIVKKSNAQNETTDTNNLNPSNNTKCDLVREDTSHTKSNPSVQQKEPKKFAFITEESMVKDIVGYLLTGFIKNGRHPGLY